MGVVKFMLVLTATPGYYRTSIPREVRKLLGTGVNDGIEWVFEYSIVVVKKRGG